MEGWSRKRGLSDSSVLDDGRGQLMMYSTSDFTPITLVPGTFRVYIQQVVKWNIVKGVVGKNYRFRSPDNTVNSSKSWSTYTVGTYFSYVRGSRFHVKFHSRRNYETPLTFSL